MSEAVHVDGDIVTSPKPDDFPAFNVKMIDGFAEGVQGQGTR